MKETKFTDDVVIGLEVHAELGTKSKLFCSCSTQGNEEPNTRTCEICIGMPGSKPSPNQEAIRSAIKLAMALSCSISGKVIFSRKSYFYPDLAKNYQITQYEEPIGVNGRIDFKDMQVKIRRVHLEEDPAALIHMKSHVLVDYNRSGNPLCEIVTEPDMHSPEEARDFMKSLITILQYLKIFDPGKNIIKADANISIRESGYTRVEIKNITGFREIERALSYEIERQKANLHEIRQETRAWNASKGLTTLLRIKETEEDYGYIYEPDIPPIAVASVIPELRKQIPELPQDKAVRYEAKLKLSKDDAFVISNDFELATIFENAVAGRRDPVLSAKWIRRELARVANYHGKSASEIDQEQFIILLEMLQSGRITEKVGQKALEALAAKGTKIEHFIKGQGLESMSDDGLLERYCQEAIKENPGAVEDYRRGKQEALNFILGAVMKKTRGTADPKQTKERLIDLLEAP